MAAKRTAKPTAVVDPLDTLFGDGETISATELAEFLSKDPKQVRAYMRSAKLRASDLKGASWKINREIATQVVTHYTPAPETAKA